MAHDPNGTPPRLDDIRRGLRILELLPAGWERLTDGQRALVLNHLDGLRDRLRGIGLALSHVVTTDPPQEG